MLRVIFAGTFAASLAEPVRRNLTIPCDVITSDETGIISRLADIDVLVTMALTTEMSRAATQLRLVQVPASIGSIARHCPRGRRWQMSTAMKPASPST